MSSSTRRGGTRRGRRCKQETVGLEGEMREAKGQGRCSDDDRRQRDLENGLEQDRRCRRSKRKRERKGKERRSV